MVSHGAVAATADLRSTATPERLADLFGPGRWLFGQSFVIGGLGSSVGSGAALRDPARDAPVAWFTRALERNAGGGDVGAATWTTVNGSVPGSTIHDGLARDWGVLAQSHPDVVVLAYGMNDGAPAQFEMGETYGGSMRELAGLIGAIRGGGAIPVILTTPSAHTTRTNWSEPPGTPVPQDSPIDTSRPVRAVPIPGVGVAPESTRHAAINAGMRGLAAALDVDLIDVEPFWLHAVAAEGEDALFDPNEFVHPNLLGHQLSYHEAIDTSLASLSVLKPPTTPAF